MKNIFLLLIASLLFSNPALSQTKKIESIYTDITAKSCKKQTATNGDDLLYRGQCSGVGGYKIILLESEHHQSLNLVTPAGKEYELNLPALSAAPSSLGTKVEWRVSRDGKKIKPIAFIVRLNVFVDPNSREKRESFLLAGKLSKGAACVTDVIRPSERNQNAKARELADIAGDKACDDRFSPE